MSYVDQLRHEGDFRPHCVIVRDNLGSVEVVCIIGEADLSAAPELDAALEGADKVADSIVLDFSACPYFDSTIIGCVVRAMKHWGEQFAVVVPHDSPLRQILGICQLEDVLPIERSVTAATARVNSRPVAGQREKVETVRGELPARDLAPGDPTATTNRLPLVT